MNNVLVYISEGPDAQETVGFEFDNMMDTTDFIETVLAYSMGKHIDIHVVKIYEEGKK